MGTAMAQPLEARRDDLAAGAERVLAAYYRSAAQGVSPWAGLPAVLDAADVAKLLGVKEGAVRKAARTGHLPMRLVCGRWRIGQLALREVVGELAATERPA